MSDRYDALERLQRLRESGALTDEEFQAEKRRLLGYDNGPAVERVTEVEVGDAPKSRTPLYVLLGAGGLAIAVAVGLLLGRTAGADQSGAEVEADERLHRLSRDLRAGGRLRPGPCLHDCDADRARAGRAGDVGPDPAPL